MNFSLTTLGTASARPIADKYPSAHLLSVGGRLFLIDCGEGAQMQLVRLKVSLLKIDNIFISHLHGDHMFGLFGLLYSMDMLNRLAPVHVYGPEDLGNILNALAPHFGQLRFEVVFHPVKCKEPVKILEFKQLEIYAFPLDHRVETYGYMFKGLWRNNPRSFAYCSDTAPFAKLAKWLKGVTMLYHEATYASDNKLLAKKTHHSTGADAGKLAAKIGAKKLVLGHYSSRYKELQVILNEAKEYFKNTYLGSEGMKFDIP